MDNLVHIAHNVTIGENTVIAAQTGISGSSIIGKNVISGGQVGIADHCEVKDGAIIGSQAGVPTGKLCAAGELSGELLRGLLRNSKSNSPGWRDCLRSRRESRSSKRLWARRASNLRYRLKIRG